MTPPPTSIDGTEITGATIDGQEVQEITIDGQTVFEAVALSDTLFAQYDFRQEDGSVPVVDQSGNGNTLVSGSYSGVSRSIGGQQAGDFDGTDSVGLGGELSNPVQMPLVIYFVMELDVIKNCEIINDGTGSGTRVHLDISNQSEMFMDPGNGPRGFFPNPGQFLFTIVFDGSNSFMRANGSEVMSGTVRSSVELDTIIIASQAQNGPFDGSVGFLEIHDGFPTISLLTREGQIGSAFGF